MISKKIDEPITSPILLEEFEDLIKRKHEWLKKNKGHKVYDMVKGEYYTMLNFLNHIGKVLDFANSEISALTQDRTETKTKLHKLKAYVSERLYNKNDINHLN